MNIVELNHVAHSFGEKNVLNNISLKIGQGELLGLLGPSGAGKTTLIKILTGQLTCEGSATIFGISCRDYLKNNFKKIGIVADNSGVYGRLSCYDNLLLFAKIHNIRDIHRNEIDYALEKVGLKDEKKKEASKLSKGMCQRLLLARAVLHKPELLFLDEPTSGLDPATADQIHRFLLELKGEGTTIFLTTHNMSEAYSICDHIALLNEGHIVEYGIPEEICRKYNLDSKIRILRRTGETELVSNCPENAVRISRLFSDNDVETIHSSEPDLGNVFMRLTGRGLTE